jgi:siroheme synthase-like protein
MLLPVALDIRGKRCLIVGGGGVAARKALSLIECEALVTVISPVLGPDLEVLRDAIEHRARTFREGDSAGFDLIFAATDRRAVNAQVALEAKQAGIWCNIADDAEGSDFHGAAAVRRGGICIGITTAAGSPALARHLKHEIESRIGAEYATLLELVAARRTHAQELPVSQRVRADLWRAILSSDVLSLLRQERRGEAEALIDALIALAGETAKPAGDGA